MPGNRRLDPRRDVGFLRGRIEHGGKRGQIFGHHGRGPQLAQLVEQFGMVFANRLEIGRLAGPRLGGEFVEEPDEQRLPFVDRLVGGSLDRLRIGRAVSHCSSSRRIWVPRAPNPSFYETPGRIR